MAVITKLEVQKRNKQKVNMYLDGEFRCGLTAESVVRNGLKAGDELSEEKLEEILFTSETEIAFNKACDYISRAMKTAKQTSDYLKKKGFDEKVADRAVKKLCGYGYVDDCRYAELFVENSGTKGARRLISELTARGVPKETAVSAAEKISPEAALENVTALAEKYMRSKEPTMENLVKLQRFLLSRGFDYDAVLQAINKYRKD